MRNHLFSRRFPVLTLSLFLATLAPHLSAGGTPAQIAAVEKKIATANARKKAFQAALDAVNKKLKWAVLGRKKLRAEAASLSKKISAEKTEIFALKQELNALTSVYNPVEKQVKISDPPDDPANEDQELIQESNQLILINPSAIYTEAELELQEAEKKLTETRGFLEYAQGKVDAGIIQFTSFRDKHLAAIPELEAKVQTLKQRVAHEKVHGPSKASETEELTKIGNSRAEREKLSAEQLAEVSRRLESMSPFSVSEADYRGRGAIKSSNELRAEGYKTVMVYEIRDAKGTWKPNQAPGQVHEFVGAGSPPSGYRGGKYFRSPDNGVVFYLYSGYKNREADHLKRHKTIRTDVSSIAKLLNGVTSMRSELGRVKGGKRTRRFIDGGPLISQIRRFKTGFNKLVRPVTRFRKTRYRLTEKEFNIWHGEYLFNHGALTEKAKRLRLHPAGMSTLRSSIRRMSFDKRVAKFNSLSSRLRDLASQYQKLRKIPRNARKRRALVLEVEVLGVDIAEFSKLIKR